MAAKKDKVIPTEFPDYEIHRDGKVFSLLSNKFISSREQNGYIYLSMVKIVEGCRKRVTVGQHQLVAMAFVDNPDPKKLTKVIHLDQNKLNNSIENLKWGTLADIARIANERPSRHLRPVLQFTIDGELIKRYESPYDVAEEIGRPSNLIKRACSGMTKTVHGFVWKYEDDKSDFQEHKRVSWKNIPNHPNYKISTKGEVYSTKTKKLLSSTFRRDGYRRICIDQGKFYIHRLMAMAFLGQAPSDMKNPVVNHKDGNKSNNTVSNLEWIEFSANIQHAHDTGLNSTCIPVVQYSLKGERIARFPSAASAARKVGVTHTAVADACKKKKSVNTIAGYVWRYESDPLVLGDLINLKTSKSRVVQYSLEGEKMKLFSSMQEASKEVGVNASSISHVCRGKIRTAGGYMWRYEGDPAPTQKTRNGSMRKVEQLTREGKVIRMWNSISEAAKELNISNSHITSVCKGKRCTTGGFMWGYVD